MGRDFRLEGGSGLRGGDRQAEPDRGAPYADLEAEDPTCTTVVLEAEIEQPKYAFEHHGSSSSPIFWSVNAIDPKTGAAAG